jgi:xanthine dehydrogenase YagS FAD-binding subunit
MPIADLFGDGSDGTRDHLLAAGQVLTAVGLPTPVAGERAGYLRVIGRHFAEWPLVEVVVRIVVANGSISFARVAVGGVAPVPLRLPGLERAMIGAAADPLVIERLAAALVRPARTLPATSYKQDLIPVAIADTLARAMEAPESSRARFRWALPWTSR